MQEISHQVSNQGTIPIPNIILPIEEPVLSSQLKEPTVILPTEEPSSPTQLKESDNDWTETMQPDEHQESLFESLKEQPIKVESTDSNGPHDVDRSETYLYGESYSDSYDDMDESLGIDESKEFDQSEEPEKSHDSDKSHGFDESRDLESHDLEMEHKPTELQATDTSKDMTVLHGYNKSQEIDQSPALDKSHGLGSHDMESHDLAGAYKPPKFCAAQHSLCPLIGSTERRGRPPKNYKYFGYGPFQSAGIAKPNPPDVSKALGLGGSEVIEEDLVLNIVPMLGQGVKLKQEPDIHEGDVNMDANNVVDSKPLLPYPVDSQCEAGADIFDGSQIIPVGELKSDVQHVGSDMLHKAKGDSLDTTMFVMKRKRGRPPKSPQPEQSNINANALKSVLKKKKIKCIYVKGNVAKRLNIGPKSVQVKAVIEDSNATKTLNLGAKSSQEKTVVQGSNVEGNNSKAMNLESNLGAQKTVTKDMSSSDVRVKGCSVAIKRIPDGGDDVLVYDWYNMT